MDLNEALARIADLEGQVSALTGERDLAAGRAAELETERSALDTRLAEADGARTALSADLAATQTRGLDYLRRALLAEHAGLIVPELVTGASEEALTASVEVAKQAYARAVESARATVAGQTVPAGAPSARIAPTAGLSPLEMIESGLRTSQQ